MGKSKNKAAKQQRPEPGELPPDEEEEEEVEVEAEAEAEGGSGPAAAAASEEAPAPAPAPAQSAPGSSGAASLPFQKRTETRVRTVNYCGVSGVPFEYCEFLPTFDESKVWFKENYSKFYPEVSDEDALTELMTRLGFEGEVDLVKILLAQGVSLFECGTEEFMFNTALHIAVRPAGRSLPL